jgi:hypothetical protein
MAEKWRQKLSCFQKTRSGVVKKGDTTKTSQTVSTPFSLEDLAQMNDISVSSK